MTLKLASAALAALALSAGAARAADYVTVPIETTVNAPAQAAWPRISSFCALGKVAKVSCVITSGKDGQVGAVRRLADRVDELLVAQTTWSYTYTQPKSPIDYHGTVEIRPVDKGHSTLHYTVVYDADALPKHEPADKAADRAARTAQFTGMLAAMKAVAEAK